MIIENHNAIIEVSLFLYHKTQTSAAQIKAIRVINHHANQKPLLRSISENLSN